MSRTTHLFRTGLAIAALALCALASAQQAGQHAHELQASMITLPSSDPGVLAALPCSSCAVLSFSTTNTTAYEIGAEKVTLEAIRRAFAENPDANVVVTVGNDFKTVQRVLITSTLKQ